MKRCKQKRRRHKAVRAVLRDADRHRGHTFKGRSFTDFALGILNPQEPVLRASTCVSSNPRAMQQGEANFLHKRRPEHCSRSSLQIQIPDLPHNRSKMEACLTKSSSVSVTKSLATVQVGSSSGSSADSADSSLNSG